MRSEWKPDDSFLSKKGQAGVDRINAALARQGFSTRRDQILTSRDPKMNLVIKELQRTNMPDGWKSYQVPLFLFKNPPTFVFYQEAEAGAVLPMHSHAVDQIRVVVWGGMVYNRKALKAGDWMFIPANVPYSISASKNPGMGVCYMYG